MPERVLVTGGAGFIGSHTVDTLLARGYKVRVLDNFSTGHMRNLRHVAAKIEIEEGDVQDRAVVERCLAKVNAVVHLAAKGSVPFSVDQPRESHLENVEGTLVVMDAVRKSGIRRLLYASSAAVYGNNPRLPREEKDEPMPASPYAVGKLADEDYARVLCPAAIGLRFFNVYGPRQDPNSPYAAVVPRFLQAVLRNEPFPIYGDGSSVRDFTYVEDAAAGILAGLEAKESVRGVFNIAGGKGISVMDLAREVARVAGKKCQVKYHPPRPGDIARSQADVRAAEKFLGFRAGCSLEEGIRRSLEWFRINQMA